MHSCYCPQTKFGLCFYRCLSVHRGGMCSRGCMAGGHVWLGRHGKGECMAGGWACVAGGCAWQGGMCGRGACMAGGVHGRGVCAWQGGVHATHAPPVDTQQDTVNERAVRILLECILVLFLYSLLTYRWQITQYLVDMICFIFTGDHWLYWPCVSTLQG